MTDNRALVTATFFAWVLRVVYVLTPFDMIPDFIPFLGLLDDLLGLLLLVGMTLYTGFRLGRSAWSALLPAEPSPVYEPLSFEDIRAL